MINRFKESDDPISMMVELTDRGSDHKTTYESDKVHDAIKFVASNADCYLHERTAGEWSFRNPVQQCMADVAANLQQASDDGDGMDDIDGDIDIE